MGSGLMAIVARRSPAVRVTRSATTTPARRSKLRSRPRSGKSKGHRELAARVERRQPRRQRPPDRYFAALSEGFAGPYVPVVAWMSALTERYAIDPAICLPFSLCEAFL